MFIALTTPVHAVHTFSILDKLTSTLPKRHFACEKAMLHQLYEKVQTRLLPSVCCLTTLLRFRLLV